MARVINQLLASDRLENQSIWESSCNYSIKFGQLLACSPNDNPA